MPLSVDDEIFIERSFQRTLIELEKLISFSGTPTVVWRRTGEIMLVGTEFSMLSEWKRDQLLFKDKDLDNIEGEVGPDGNALPSGGSTKEADSELHDFQDSASRRDRRDDTSLRSSISRAVSNTMKVSQPTLSKARLLCVKYVARR